MGLTIAYSKIKERNLVLINNDTYQRETLSEWPIRPPLKKHKSNQIYRVSQKTAIIMKGQIKIQYLDLFQK